MMHRSGSSSTPALQFFSMGWEVTQGTAGRESSLGMVISAFAMSIQELPLYSLE
jgi:hypothetical protein